MAKRKNATASAQLKRFGEAVREVEAAAGHFFWKAGELPEKPSREWTLNDIHPPLPTEHGGDTREIYGPPAAVLTAAAAVKDVYDNLFGARARLSASLAQLEQAAQAVHAALSDPATAAYLKNAGAIEQTMQFGTDEPHDISAVQARLGRLQNMDKVAEIVAGARTALDARRPRAVAAGLYDAKGGGPASHFVLELHDIGFGPRDIAEIVAFRQGSRRKSPYRDEALDKAEGAVERTLRRYRRRFQYYWRTASEQESAGRVSRVDRWGAVLVSAHVKAHGSVSIHLGGGGDLSGAGGHGSPLDPHGTPPKPASGS